MSRRIRRPANVGLRMAQESSAANDYLEKQGLYLPERPEDTIPRLADVEDITALDDAKLMDLFNKLTAWADYVSTQLACCQVDERAATEVLNRAEAESLVRDWGGTSKDRVTVAKAERATDPDVLERKEELRGAYAYRKLVEVLYQGIDRDAAAVSREITRRTSGADPKVRRADRWSK